MNDDEKTPVIMAIDPGLGGAAAWLVDPATASIGQEPPPLPRGAAKQSPGPRHLAQHLESIRREFHVHEDEIRE
jgi:hypothetical protein